MVNWIYKDTANDPVKRLRVYFNENGTLFRHEAFNFNVEEKFVDWGAASQQPSNSSKKIVRVLKNRPLN